MFKKSFTLLSLLLVSSLQFSYASPAPNFKLPTSNGEISLSDFKGKVVYVDFWASWCAPCRKSFPWMNKMQTKYESQGLQIIGISLDSRRRMADKFLEEMPALFKIAYDTEGKTADEYKVQVMPTSFLIDRSGQILLTHKGFKTKHEAALQKEFEKALKK